MKIIDEKGRLLGKINAIDFLVIIFFLSLTPMFYFGYKISHKKPSALEIQNVEAQKKKFIETELGFVFKKIDPQTTSLISSGDKEINGNNGILGEILSLGEVRPFYYEVVIGSNKKAIADSVFKDLPVTLRIQAEVRQNNLYYKDRQINENSIINFVTDKYTLEALYMPTLLENNNRAEDVSDSIKIIEQKQKEIEYEVSKLQNKISFSNEKISSLENRIASMEASSVTKKQEAVKNK